jgi:predicted membrane metal-binding protein
MKFFIFLIIGILIVLTYTPLLSGYDLFGFSAQFIVWCIGPIILLGTILAYIREDEKEGEL